MPQCLKCELNFLNEDGLENHTKLIHTKKEVKASKYKCDRCADIFRVRDDLRKHKLLPLEFSCELCEKKGEVSVLPTK